MTCSWGKIWSREGMKKLEKWIQLGHHRHNPLTFCWRGNDSSGPLLLFFEGQEHENRRERKSRTYQRWREPWVSEWLRIEFLCLILHPSIVSRKKRERKKVWNHFRSLIMFHLLYFSILYFSFSFKSLSVFVNPFLFLTSLFLLPMKKVKREMHHLNILVCVTSHNVYFEPWKP